MVWSSASKLCKLRKNFYDRLSCANIATGARNLSSICNNFFSFELNRPRIAGFVNNDDSKLCEKFFIQEFLPFQIYPDCEQHRQSKEVCQCPTFLWEAKNVEFFLSLSNVEAFPFPIDAQKSENHPENYKEKHHVNVTYHCLSLISTIVSQTRVLSILQK